MEGKNKKRENEEEVWRLRSRYRSGHHVRRYAIFLTFRMPQFPQN